MMTGASQLISQIEREWELEEGFLGAARQGRFDKTAGNRLLSVLKSTDFGDQELLERRLVSLLWYIPLFLGWQEERIANSSGNIEIYRQLTNQIQTEVERILGIP